MNEIYKGFGNFMDSSFSLNDSIIFKKNEVIEKENEININNNFFSQENFFEIEENPKELKYENYSTEESKNYSNNIINVDNNNKIFNNNINNNTDNEESLNNSQVRSIKSVTKEQVLECFFTCSVCLKILYSPFICKTCGESACHSCFSKSIKNRNNSDNIKSKKYENQKFNFCRFCKNDNVSIMPNFKVLQLKEDILKNYKNYHYLQNSTIEFLNKLKEYAKFEQELFEANNKTDLCTNNTNKMGNIKKKEFDNPHQTNKNSDISLNQIKPMMNPYFYRTFSAQNPINILDTSGILRKNYVNNLNNFQNQNFIFNNCTRNYKTFVNKSNMTKYENSNSNDTNNFNRLTIPSTNLINMSNENIKNLILSNAKYFIVRSIYKENLEISKKFSLWATTPFNENKLREAFNNNFVILLFTHSNNSLFYGCALIKSIKVKAKKLEIFENDLWKNDRGIKLGNSFKITWLSNCEIPIYKLRVMNNPLNKNIPVLKSKDCQEVPFSIGSYIFKICESFSYKASEEINYKEIYSNLLKKKDPNTK